MLLSYITTDTEEVKFMMNYSKGESESNDFLFISSNLRMRTRVIEASTPLNLAFQIKVYKTAQSRPLCRIATGFVF